MLEGFGHRFQDPGLLKQALRHRSAGTPNNERLEFLGDAPIEHVLHPRSDLGTVLDPAQYTSPDAALTATA